MATAVIMPRQGQSVESCILVEWLVSPSDTVEAGAILANIETDKAVFEVEAPEAGTVLELFCEAGDDVPVLAHIAAIGAPGEDVSGLRPNGTGAPAESPATETAPEPAAAAVAAAPAAMPAGDATSTGVSPRARKAAAEAGVDATQLAGTGPGGRVIERDIVQAAAGAPRLSPAAKAAAQAGDLRAPATGTGPGGMVLAGDLQAGGAPASPAAAPGATTEIPVSGIRKLIAEKMHQSLASTAQLTLNRSFDARSLQAFRKRVKARAEQLGLPNITLNDMIVYATARTLKKYPTLNAHYLGSKIVQFGSVNMGVAMDTPRGLMVPVLSGASEMTLTAISRGIKPMVEAAQSGSINPDLLSGGTFTITNMGMLGIESFTPILNVPEVAILGVGGINLKPVQGPDGVDFVPSINLSLTVDHQGADGADGARFLQDLAAALEDFELTLAE